MTMRVEKILHEWPLSKVELIIDGGRKYIRKTVHRDFGMEAGKQEAVFGVASGFRIPEILGVEHGSDSTVMTMEYFEPIREPTASEADRLLSKFHAATKPLSYDPLFRSYSLHDLEVDLRTAHGYGALPEEIMDPGFFRSIFQDVAVLHGDWGLDQIIISSEGPVILDLGKAFTGPRILDIAHRFRFGGDDYALTEDPQLLKAFVVVDVMTIAWFDLCKRNYIDYSYTKEIQNGLAAIRRSCERLGLIT